MFFMVDVLRQRLQWKSFLRALSQKDWNEKRVCRPKYSPCIFNILQIIFFIGLFVPLQTLAQSNAAPKHEWVGKASYYHVKFNGHKTATGAKFQNENLTAACNKVKLGTVVKVTNLANGKSVVVLVNDRMGLHNKRLIDLTTKGAEQIGFLHAGICKVKMELYVEEDVKDCADK